MSFPEVFTWIFDIWLSAIKYTIEVHDTSGNLVSVLQNAHSIFYSENINQAPMLRFSIPADDSKEEFLVKPYEIWLRDYEPESPEIVNKFRLSKRIDGRQDTIITSIECDGILNQLADEQHIVDYEASSQTVTQIVTALLALQVLTPSITIGTISPTNTVSMKASTGDTLLRTLLNLRDMVGGYIYVDDDRALQWASSIGQDVGQQIRYQKNLLGVNKETDFTTIANRIYAYGSGSGSSRVKLSQAAGSPPDYVEDATSQSAYGINVKTFIDRSITDPDALLLWANRKLADLKDPLITYSVDNTDLSQSVEGGFEFEPITLGSTIQLIDEDLGLDVSVHVVKITHRDLLHPEHVQLEVTDLASSTPEVRAKDILDVITGTEEAIATAEKLSPSPTELSSVTFIIDGGGSAISTGEKGHITLPFYGEIVSAELEADQSGSIVIDIWRDTFANFPPTNADSITASAPPTLSSDDSVLDSTLTGWTTAFSEGDILAFNVDSITTVTRVTLTLKVRRT